MRSMTQALAFAATLLAAPAVMAQGATGTAPGSTAPGTSAPATSAPGTAAPASPGGMGVNRAPGNAPGMNPPSGDSATTREAPPVVATPAAGANSFTEGQARSRIEAAGFTDIKELKKDEQGVWRGQAMRNGTATPVGLDFQGNVVAGPAPAR